MSEDTELQEFAPGEDYGNRIAYLSGHSRSCPVCFDTQQQSLKNYHAVPAVWKCRMCKKVYSYEPVGAPTRGTKMSFVQEPIGGYIPVEPQDVVAMQKTLQENAAQLFGKKEPSKPSIAADILQTAASIVTGERNTTHGEMERSFQVIAELWQSYLCGRKGKPENMIEPVDVASMMVLLKIARSIQGTPVKDHYVDAAGYAAIAGELQGV